MSKTVTYNTKSCGDTNQGAQTLTKAGREIKEEFPEKAMLN